MGKPSETTRKQPTIPEYLRDLADPEVLAILFVETPKKIEKLTDIAGQSTKSRTAKDIDRHLAEERNSW